MSATFLTRWFGYMDSDRPERILELISDDFSFSIVFSTGTHAATDFSGGREAMQGYLGQRQQNTRTHHLLTSTVDGDVETFLGEVRRLDGSFEASFVAAGRVGDSGRLERLLISRSPGVRFTD